MNYASSVGGGAITTVVVIRSEKEKPAQERVLRQKTVTVKKRPQKTQKQKKAA